MRQKVALVTGAMGGIGTAICKSLAEEGCRILANCLPGEPRRDEWLAAMRNEGWAVDVVEGDVSDHATVQAMAERIGDEFGGVDILVNNAGITRDAALRKMSRADWDAVLDVNLGSLFSLTQALLPAMVDRGWGRVINISSVNGVKGQFGQANYSAAKAGVLGFTRAVAQEVAKKGVTVNAVAPGYIATDMVMAVKEEVREQIVAQVPAGRLGRPEEVAHVVRFLASDLAGYVTGATLNVNGGMHMY